MNNLVAKGKTIAFFNGSEFADYILQAVNQQGVSYTQMMQLFKEVDALAVDDIGFLNNDSMPRVMREFKAILDHLISGGKFGLFTGAFLPPDDRWNLIPEVSTRLVTGYVASVEVPDRNLRRDIIENEFAKVGIDVVQNVVSFIADADIRDIRTIQEICHRLTVEKDAGNPLDIERVAGVLKSHHIKTQPPDEQIVTQAMERMNKRIGLDELKRKDLPKELFLIRNETMYELVEKEGISQTSVAHAFGMSPQRISMIVGAIKKKQA
jgi:chromosomal replication initiation ATPase DnaA